MASVRSSLARLTLGLSGLCALVAPSAVLAQSSDLSIGVILPESFPSAEQAAEIRNGMTLALRSSSLGAPALIIKDSACDLKKAQTAVQQLIAAKVDVVIGGFCELGEVPRLLKAAGIPFVSANSERMRPGDGMLQLGRVPVGLGEEVAGKLRTQTKLRITASSACWIDYSEPSLKKYDGELCPVLFRDDSRWKEINGSYQVAFRKPLTVSAARGHAAMELAVSYLKRLRTANSRQALIEAQSTKTVLGTPMSRDAATPADALRLYFAEAAQKPGSREAKAAADVSKAMGCGCKAGADCGKAGPLAAQPFQVVAPGAKAPMACGAPAVAKN